MYDCTRSYWFCDTIGPMAVFGSAGSPTGKERIVSTIARFTASSRLFGNEEPGSCGTGLSTIHKGKHKSRRDRLLESRIAEQDGGRFTPQFQRDALHRGGAVAHDRLANGNRARERDLGDVGIAHEFGPD